MANSIYIINTGFNTNILALKNEPVNSGTAQALQLFYASATRSNTALTMAIILKLRQWMF